MAVGSFAAAAASLPLPRPAIACAAPRGLRDTGVPASPATLLTCRSSDRPYMTRSCSHIQESYSASACRVLPAGRRASPLPDTCSAGRVCQPPGHSPGCAACSPADDRTAHHLSLHTRSLALPQQMSLWQLQSVALPALFVMRQPAQDKWVQSMGIPVLDIWPCQ